MRYTNRCLPLPLRSRVTLKAGEIRDNVAVGLPIPMVDRGRGDPRNIGVIVDRSDSDM